MKILREVARRLSGDAGCGKCDCMGTVLQLISQRGSMTDGEIMDRIEIIRCMAARQEVKSPLHERVGSVSKWAKDEWHRSAV